MIFTSDYFRSYVLKSYILCEIVIKWVFFVKKLFYAQCKCVQFYYSAKYIWTELNFYFQEINIIFKYEYKVPDFSTKDNEPKFNLRRRKQTQDDDKFEHYDYFISPDLGIDQIIWNYYISF